MDALDRHSRASEAMSDQEMQLMMKNLPTIDITIEKRRETEDYCTQYTRCFLLDIRPDARAYGYSNIFESCLKDEEDSGEDKDNP